MSSSFHSDRSSEVTSALTSLIEKYFPKNVLYEPSGEPSRHFSQILRFARGNLWTANHASSRWAQQISLSEKDIQNEFQQIADKMYVENDIKQANKLMSLFLRSLQYLRVAFSSPSVDFDFSIGIFRVLSALRNSVSPEETKKIQRESQRWGRTPKKQINDLMSPNRERRDSSEGSDVSDEMTEGWKNAFNEDLKRDSESEGESEDEEGGEEKEREREEEEKHSHQLIPHPSSQSPPTEIFDFSTSSPPPLSPHVVSVKILKNPIDSKQPNFTVKFIENPNEEGRDSFDYLSPPNPHIPVFIAHPYHFSPSLPASERDVFRVVLSHASVSPIPLSEIQKIIEMLNIANFINFPSISLFKDPSVMNRLLISPMNSYFSLLSSEEKFIETLQQVSTSSIRSPPTMMSTQNFLHLHVFHRFVSSLLSFHLHGDKQIIAHRLNDPKDSHSLMTLSDFIRNTLQKRMEFIMEILVECGAVRVTPSVSSASPPHVTLFPSPLSSDRLLDALFSSTHRLLMTTAPSASIFSPSSLIINIFLNVLDAFLDEIDAMFSQRIFDAKEEFPKFPRFLRIFQRDLKTIWTQQKILTNWREREGREKRDTKGSQSSMEVSPLPSSFSHSLQKSSLLEDFRRKIHQWATGKKPDKQSKNPSEVSPPPSRPSPLPSAPSPRVVLPSFSPPPLPFDFPLSSLPSSLSSAVFRLPEEKNQKNPKKSKKKASPFEEFQKAIQKESSGPYGQKSLTAPTPSSLSPSPSSIFPPLPPLRLLRLSLPSFHRIIDGALHKPLRKFIENQRKSLSTVFLPPFISLLNSHVCVFFLHRGDLWDSLLNRWEKIIPNEEENPIEFLGILESLWTSHVSPSDCLRLPLSSSCPPYRLFLPLTSLSSARSVAPKRFAALLNAFQTVVGEEISGDSLGDLGNVQCDLSAVISSSLEGFLPFSAFPLSLSVGFPFGEIFASPSSLLKYRQIHQFLFALQRCEILCGKTLIKGERFIRSPFVLRVRLCLSEFFCFFRHFRGFCQTTVEMQRDKTLSEIKKSKEIQTIPSLDSFHSEFLTVLCESFLLTPSMKNAADALKEMLTAGHIVAAIYNAMGNNTLEEQHIDRFAKLVKECYLPLFRLRVSFLLSLLRVASSSSVSSGSSDSFENSFAALENQIDFNHFYSNATQKNKEN